MSFFKNIRLVGFKDAIFWANVTLDGGVITTDRLDAHIRAYDRAMGRCMMINKLDRYRVLGKCQARLKQMRSRIVSRRPVAK
jgi:hypothetical protein